MKIRISFIFICLLTLLSSCKNDKSLKSNVPQLQIDNYIGNYVTNDYFNRSEGYDWVVVSISKINDNEAEIKVRSRVDKKKATCTFDGIGSLISKDTLKTVFENKAILFCFKNENLAIITDNQEDENLLYYFCSGGASLTNNYTKLNEPLDTEQLLFFDYTKTLSLQNITFEIKSTNSGSLNTLFIQPKGLEIVNEKVIHEIDGTVTNVEIEDMNSDGWPEILVYITSAGSGSYGNIIGYSVNNGKSMSQIYFPQTSDNDEINKGYMGHDEFTLVERYLAQRFPIYETGDKTAQPSGKIRQVIYELTDGENSRILKIKNVSEYNLK